MQRPESFSGEILLRTRRRLGVSEVVAGGMHLDIYQRAIQVSDSSTLARCKVLLCPVAAHMVVWGACRTVLLGRGAPNSFLLPPRLVVGTKQCGPGL